MAKKKRFAILVTKRVGRRVLRTKGKKPLSFTLQQAKKEIKSSKEIPISKRAKNPRIVKITPALTRKVNKGLI